MALLVAAPWLLDGCRSTPVQRGAPVTAAEKASANSNATIAGDCAHIRAAICRTAGTNSSECRAAQYTFPLLSERTCIALRADESNVLARLRAIRQPCLTLVERLCSDLQGDSDVCEVVQAQTAAFSVQRCNSMLARYDHVLRTLREIAQGTKLLTLPEQTLVAEGDRPSFGPADAKVVLVEFSDFQCPYCKGAAETARQVQKQFGKQVRFVFRQFPLPFHAHARLAAEASLAAHAQGKFWPYHDLLFAHQKALSRGDLERYAQTAGLDVELFRKQLDEHRHAAAVSEDIGIGNQVHVNGTPTLFINGRRVANPSDTPAVLKSVHDALITEMSGSNTRQVMLSQQRRRGQ